MRYSDDAKKEFVEYLKSGMGRVDTCMLVGIAYKTFMVWMRTNKEFRNAVKKAETTHKYKNVLLIEKAGYNQWQAAAWMLERKYPEEFSERKNISLLQNEELDRARNEIKEVVSDLKAIKNDITKEQIAEGSGPERSGQSQPQDTEAI